MDPWTTLVVYTVHALYYTTVQDVNWSTTRKISFCSAARRSLVRYANRPFRIRGRTRNVVSRQRRHGQSSRAESVLSAVAGGRTELGGAGSRGRSRDVQVPVTSRCVPRFYL